MQITETSAEGLKHEFKIVVGATEMKERLASRLGELSRSVRMPGFRPGKVPSAVLRQRFGKALVDEVVTGAVSETANQAINDRGLRPALQPKIDIQDYKEGSDLEYTMAVEVLPEVVPMDFTALELERLKVKIPDDEVEKALERIAAERKVTKPLETPRPAKEGDVAVVDFVGRVEGKTLPGLDAQGYHLELGSKSFIEGFEEQLVGKSAGDKVTVKVTFPADYGNQDIAGKEAEFDVEIKELREVVPAKVDDELAKASGVENLDALRSSVRDALQRQYDAVTGGRLKRALLDKLADNHHFAVPQGMLDLEFETIWRQVEEAKARGELDEEDKAKSEDTLKAEYRDIAERRVRLGLLLSEVGQRNNITVSDQEMSQALMMEAQRHPGHERQVLELYRKNPQALASLRAPVFENKAVNFILERAKIAEREVTAEELMKEAAAEAEGDVAPAKKEKKSRAKGKSAKASGSEASKSE
jgi:trigger factor